MFTKAEQADALASLRQTLRRGDQLFVATKSVSRSGMSRTVTIYTFRGPRGKVRALWLTRLVARALRWSYLDDSETLRVHGCGMDMHFHTVYELAYKLFGDGNALQKVSL